MSNRHAMNGKGKSKNFQEKCKVYRSTEQKLANKIRKLIRYIKKMPNDLLAKETLERINN